MLHRHRLQCFLCWCYSTLYLLSAQMYATENTHYNQGRQKLAVPFPLFFLCVRLPHLTTPNQSQTFLIAYPRALGEIKTNRKTSRQTDRTNRQTVTSTSTSYNIHRLQLFVLLMFSSPDLLLLLFAKLCAFFCLHPRHLNFTQLTFVHLQIKQLSGG